MKGYQIYTFLNYNYNTHKIASNIIFTDYESAKNYLLFDGKYIEDEDLFITNGIEEKNRKGEYLHYQKIYEVEIYKDKYPLTTLKKLKAGIYGE